MSYLPLHLPIIRVSGVVADVLARRKEMIPDGAEKDVLMDLAAVLMEVLTKTPIQAPIQPLISYLGPCSTRYFSPWLSPHPPRASLPRASLPQVGRHHEALPYVEESLRLEPRYRYALGYRGLLMHTLGRYCTA